MQFHLLPIRDWNEAIDDPNGIAKYGCNFTYSLLGIETAKLDEALKLRGNLQFHLLPIRDWNSKALTDYQEKIAISLTPY